MKCGRLLCAALSLFVAVAASAEDAARPFVPNLAAASDKSSPQGKKLGVGLQLGYPTALNVKYMLRSDVAVQGGIGGLSGFAYTAPALSLHADVVWHPYLLASTDAFHLTTYIGGGANLMVFSDARQKSLIASWNYYYYPSNLWLGARVPLGLDLALTQLPFDLFLEVTPSVLVFPGFTFGLGAALGGRFFFL